MNNRKTVIDKRHIAESIDVLWEPLSEEQRQYLLDNMEIHVFKKNEVIYHKGEKPRYLRCLLEGKVKVYIDGTGGRQIVRLITDMGFFAYRAAFAGENFNTEASAFETSTICQIPFTVVWKLIEANSSLAIFFIKQLAAMVGETDLLVISLTQKHIRGRLAESLIRLRDKYGVEEDGSTLSIYLSREDLANMSNMTTSNAIRTLSAFAAEKLIAIDGRKIKIIDDEGLQHISSMG